MKLLKNIKQTKNDSQGGFTLIELLVVIGILAILLAITLIAINPNKHFEDVRNTQRSSNVGAILDGIYEYESANNGNEPPSVANVTSTPVPLASVPTAQTATSTSFSTPDLTFSGLSGNTVTGSVGNVTVTGCTQAGDNGTFALVSGTSSTIVVNDAGGSVTTATGCSVGSWTGHVDLCANIVPTFLAALPMDPSVSAGTACSGTYNTGYTIASSSGRFTISAPAAEDSQTISVTR
jgi:prepilin-type N-terminal cleavage/methylation domain-containing protein